MSTIGCAVEQTSWRKPGQGQRLGPAPAAGRRRPFNHCDRQSGRGQGDRCRQPVRSRADHDGIHGVGPAHGPRTLPPTTPPRLLMVPPPVDPSRRQQCPAPRTSRPIGGAVPPAVAPGLSDRVRVAPCQQLTAAPRSWARPLRMPVRPAVRHRRSGSSENRTNPLVPGVRPGLKAESRRSDGTCSSTWKRPARAVLDDVRGGHPPTGCREVVG